MQGLKFASIVSSLTFSVPLALSGVGCAIAQPSPISPTSPQPAVPSNSNFHPKPPVETPTSSLSLTPLPIVPACPFPDVRLSKAAETAIGFSKEIHFGFGEVTVETNELTSSADAEIIYPGDVSDRALRSRASNLVGDKKPDSAVLTAQKIKKADIRVQALLEIAEVYAEIGQADKAHRLVQPLPPAPVQKNTFRSKDYVLEEIATAYRKQGNLEQETKVVNELSDLAARSSLLQKIAESYGDRKQFERGAAVLSLAIADYKTATKNAIIAGGQQNDKQFEQFQRFVSSTSFAGLYLRLKQRDKAIALLDEALANAKAIPKMSPFGFAVLSGIPVLYQAAGREDKAKEVLPFVLKTAQSYEEPITKSLGLIMAAQDYAVLKQPDQVTALLSQAMAIVKGDQVVAHENIIWVSLAKVYAYSGQYDQAFQTISTVEPVTLRDQVKQTLICSQKQK